MKKDNLPSSENDRGRVLYLDLARVFAIMFVALNHGVNRSFSIYSDTFIEYASSSFLTSVFKSGLYILSRVGVPLFLMITGTLILRKSFEKRTDFKSFYIHNWGRLLITCEIWFLITYLWGMWINLNDAMQTWTVSQKIGNCILNALFINQYVVGSMWYVQMIVPIYLILPFLAVLLKRGYGKYLVIPCLCSYIITMLVPDLNDLFRLCGVQLDMKSSLIEPVYHLCIYILLGYYISSETCILRRLCNSQMLLCLAVSFGAISQYQLWAFKSEPNVILGYESTGILIVSIFAFEVLRRYAYLFEKFRGVIQYISSRAFGIYFVHILIMETMVHFVNFTGWKRVPKAIFLQFASLGASLAAIAVLSKIKVLKKYMFLIK